MRKEILSVNSESFLDRFNNFHDGLIRRIQIEYPKNSITPVVFIIVEVQDWDTEKNEWVNITLEIQDVTKFTLKQDEEDHLYAVILSFKTGFFNDLIYLNFTAAFLSSTSNVDEFEQSPFLIVGKRCFWHTMPL